MIEDNSGNQRLVVGLYVLATGRYIKYIRPLIETAEKHFLKNHVVKYYVRTDGDVPTGVIRIPGEKVPWPIPALMKYHYLVSERTRFDGLDYLYNMDADSIFASPVGDEILGDLVGVVHPYFYNKNNNTYPYERRPESTAFIGLNEGRAYYIASFWGGKKDRVLHMVSMLKNNIEADLSRYLIAKWHDESYLNRYFYEYAPDVSLDPAYCYPDKWRLPFKKKIVAVTKNASEDRAYDDDRVRVVAYIVAHNEEAIIAYTLRHYLEFCERVIVLDDRSTDKTRDVATLFDRVEVRRISLADGGREYTESRLQAMKNACYKEQREKVDYVVVCDADEILWHPDMKKYLSDSKQSNVRLFKAKGYQMVSSRFPTTAGQIYDEVRQGVEDDATFGKIAMFDPNVEINYERGAHRCHPVPAEPAKDGLKLLHCKYLGLDYVAKRYEYLRQRCMAKHMKPTKWHIKQYRDYLRSAKEVVT